MIGQTMINVKSGARTRLSTFLAGVFLLILVVALGDIVGKIPMAALVGVMIMVSISTFDWHSIAPKTLRRMPKSETSVMLVTVAVTVAHPQPVLRRHRRRPARAGAVRPPGGPPGHPDQRSVRPTARPGPTPSPESCSSPPPTICTPSSTTTIRRRAVVIDLTGAHLWDASTTATLDAITTKFERHHKTVEIVGLDADSTARHERLSGHLGGEH